jgi:hypothetical protein
MLVKSLDLVLIARSRMEYVQVHLSHPIGSLEYGIESRRVFRAVLRHELSHAVKKRGDFSRVGFIHATESSLPPVHERVHESVVGKISLERIRDGFFHVIEEVEWQEIWHGTEDEPLNLVAMPAHPSIEIARVFLLERLEI